MPTPEGPSPRVRAQIEDILWLIEVDRADSETACRRVGTTLSAIEKACRTHGWREDLRRILQAQAWPVGQGNNIGKWLDRFDRAS